MKKPRRLLWVMFAGVLVALISVPVTLRTIEYNKELATRAGLLKIRMAIDRLNDEHDGERFCDPAALLADGYIDEWPENPYTHEPMRCVAFGDHPSAGDYAVLAVTFSSRPLCKNTYHICAFGAGPNKGVIISTEYVNQKVIFLTSSGYSNTIYGCFGPMPLEKAIELTDGGRKHVFIDEVLH